jgi:hypothetical protein
VEQLLAALDALGAEDLAPLCGPALLDRLGPLLVAQNRLAAEVARTVRACEVSGAAEVDGLKTMASWLRGHAHLSAAEAARVVRAGRALAHLPGMAEAFAAGDVSGEQAGLIGQVAEPKALALAAEHGVDLSAVDTVLTGVARTAPCADVAKAVRHYLDRLDSDGPEPDPTEGRRLVLATHADGSITGRFDLDAVGGEKLQTALESLVQAGRGAADERSRSQQLADALVQLCDNALAAGLPAHPARAQAAGDRQDRHRGPGRPVHRTGRGGDGLRRSDLRGPRPLAGVRRAGHPHRHGPRPGAAGPRPHGAAVPPHVRRAAEVRDGGCVFAGCSAPTWWCDTHHLLAWIDGGATDLDNAALLCERHHTKVHHGFRVERQPDGRWRTWRPDGTEILVSEPFLAAY